MLFSLLFLLVPSRSQVVFRSSWKITEILDWTQLLKVINRWVFHCLTGSFYGMDREQYYPDLKISKSRSTKICGATTLFSNKTEIVKWDKKYENCYWITRDCHFFFQTIYDVITFWFGRFSADQKATLQKFSWNRYMKLCYVQGNWGNNCVMITFMVAVYIALRGDGRHALQIS